MVALRTLRRPEHESDIDGQRLSRPNPWDWLTLEQAACELGVSVSTVRRRVRKGKLRNRIVPRKGGFAYRIYIAGSRHGRELAGHSHGDVDRPLDVSATHAPRDLRDLDAYRRERERRRGEVETAAGNDEIRRLEDQVERLSEALSRALKIKQRSLPPGMGEPDTNPADPYARYRWLVRKRRWWPF